MPADASDDFLRAALPSLDLVYNLARRTLSDRSLVEDFVQETYVKAFEAWAKGCRPRRVEPWMATICLNLLRSYFRRASTRREVVVDEIDVGRSADDTVESQAIVNVRASLVHGAMSQLPDEQRIAVTLMDLNGFTAHEVARITHAPRGTVLSRVHRGRKRLAEILLKEVEQLEA